MFLTGPKVVKTVTGEDVSQEDLGGASVHSTKSGVTHFTAKTEEEGLSIIRKLLSYIPQNNLEESPLVPCDDPIDRLEDSLNEIVPDSPNKPYDMYEVIGAIIDNGEFLEIQKSACARTIAPSKVHFRRFTPRFDATRLQIRSAQPRRTIPASASHWPPSARSRLHVVVRG